MEEFIIHTIVPVFLVVLFTGATIVLGIAITMMLKDLKDY
jgi:hypothetical protein